MARIIPVILLFIIPYRLLSQILPKEDSHLNFRIIGFSFPAEKGNASCSLEIAKGHFNNADSFRKNIIKSIPCKTNKIIAEVPAFGSDYTWRTVYTNKGKKTPGELRHFSVEMSVRVDTSISRLRIIKNVEKYKDAYIFIDATCVLYDMQGNPVWFLPDIDSNKVTENSAIRDMKVSPQGTITFGSGNDIYEISYTGIVLWKGPNTGEISGDSIEHYHHEFTRLADGHYMALGNQTVSWELPNYTEYGKLSPFAARPIKDSNNKFHQNMLFGTVIEYDKNGKVLWSWKSSDYFKNSDLVNAENGVFEMYDTHQNSFFFDEQNNTLYIGFRDISRILKVKYPEGNVIADYGTKYTPGIDEMGNDLFYGQHSIRHSKNGYLDVYNNNTFAANALPKIEMLQESVSHKDTLKKVWEYQCTLEGMADNEVNIYKKEFEQKKIMDSIRQEREKSGKYQKKIQLTGGGNAIELADQSIFVSMSGPIGKIFIVNRDKKIMWSSILEKKVTKEEKWHQQSTYRASIVTERKDIEQLIWNAEEPLPAITK